MSEEPKVVVVQKHSEAVLYICITVMVILCFGEPDLLDAIISRVGSP